MYLYLDTVNHLVLGLYDHKQKKWQSFKEVLSKKTSGIIHKEVYDLLSQSDIKLANIEGAIITSGPGSYTGMRVAKGFADILSWNNISVNSFYHFEVPKLVGLTSYSWISYAFKGELFEFQLQEGIENHYLHQEDSFSFENKKILFTHFFDDSHPFPEDVRSSSNMIKESPEKVFHDVLNYNFKRPLFYYRTLDQEFKKSSKGS